MFTKLTQQLGAAAVRAMPFVVALLVTNSAQGQLTDSGGMANRAVGRLANLNVNGPGYLYYGVNGADRGLGYIGSYMTLGGFIPMVEDDLGGVWNTDLRSHLSVNGGFFSNIGAVRKQLLGGGSLLGFGIFWDYDGDLNQYSTFGEPAAIFGQFGHVFNQVGVSGELVTDWGNLRSNGYIPVGQTGFQLLNGRTQFIQNYIIAQNGLDAALGGADLELGAYIPALADWAGMINVGGYAYGNGRYTQNFGPEAGTDLVPWFGGIYTRIDLTLADNWDFSIRYNNDSFFDSTGYVRLTYRMGGSRRRNVPDQMEQPMVRNEHVVRAHETPLVALNTQNSNQPWQVVHVDSSALPGGDGTAEAPFRTLADAEGSALVSNAPWTITYVRPGQSSAIGNVANNPYTDSFTFQQQNQFLVGSGGPLTIGTQPLNGSSLLTIPAITTTNPVLSNNTVNGQSVVIANDNGGATIANLQILGSTLGIDASGDLDGSPQPVGTTANPFGTPLATAGGSAVRNVSIAGDGTSAIQRGVRISAIRDGLGPNFFAGTEPTGNIEFSDTRIENTTSVAFQVGTFDESVPPTPANPIPVIAGSGGSANIDYHGSMTNNIAENGNFSSIIIGILGTSGGTINLAATAAPTSSTVPNQILDVGGEGILIAANNSPTLPVPGNTVINIGNTTLANTTPTAITIFDDHATTFISTVATPTFAHGITKSTGDATIGILRGGPTFTYLGTINNSASATPNGPIIGIRDVSNANINISGPGIGPLLSSSGNVDIQNTTGSDVSITGLNLEGTNNIGISVDLASNNSTFTFTDTQIKNATASGITLLGNNSDYTFTNTVINLTGAATGILADATGSMTFTDLDITMDTTGGSAFVAGSAAISGDVTVNGTSNLLNNSTTAPAIDVRANTVDMTFASVTSGVDNATGLAVDFNGTGSGTFTVTGAFTVGGLPGTAGLPNVNAGAVTVSVP